MVLGFARSWYSLSMTFYFEIFMKNSYYWLGGLHAVGTSRSKGFSKLSNIHSFWLMLNVIKTV